MALRVCPFSVRAIDCSHVGGPITVLDICAICDYNVPSDCRRIPSQYAGGATGPCRALLRAGSRYIASSGVSAMQSQPRLLCCRLCNPMIERPFMTPAPKSFAICWSCTALRNPIGMLVSQRGRWPAQMYSVVGYQICPQPSGTFSRKMQCGLTQKMKAARKS